jgi:ribonuclease P protein component
MSQPLSFAFGRHERLKSDVLISNLYQKGNAVTKYPLRITYLLHHKTYYTDSSVKVSINAGKKGLRLAVKRNRMKRVLRDIYRHHKHVIGNTLDQHGLCLSLAVVYVGSHLSDYDTLERLYLKLQKRLIDAIAAEAKSVSALTDSIGAEVTSISPPTDSIGAEVTSISPPTDAIAAESIESGDSNKSE